MAAYSVDSSTLTAGRGPIPVKADTVSASLFGLLGVQPALGRDFLNSEDTAGHDAVILSDRFWRTHFDADPGVLGKTVRLNGVAVSVVGVMPSGFQFPIRAEATDVWVAFARDVETRKDTPALVARNDHRLEVITRVKPGISLQQVNSELVSMAQALAAEYPETNTHPAIVARPELEYLAGDTRTPLLILFAAVGLVLAIACVNVANLLLARGTGRAREIALRLAIGASRARIVRQLVTESLVLSVTGAALGIVATYGALTAALHLHPSNLPRAQDIGVDLRVLVFTTGVAILTGILFGLAPALPVSRPDVTETMREGGQTSTAGARHDRLRSGLVIGEAALGVMLVVGAGLVVRSFEHLSHSEIGFNPSHLVTAQFNLSEARYSLDQQDRFLTELFNHLGVLPGVTAAAGAFPLPLYNDRWSTNFDLEERPLPRESQPLAGFYVVVPGFFETMEIPLVSGRAFDARDRRDSAPVMIVTQAFVRKYFPEEDPIGRQITVVLSEGPRHGNYRPREVIGVVGDIRRSNLESAPAPAFYVPLPQLMLRPPFLMVRTAAGSATVTRDIRDTLARMDPEIALYDVSSMDERLALDLGLSRFQTVLLGVFAGIALLLTAVGFYGVMAYAVGQRIHEIGVRQALGATTWNVLVLVMSRGVRLTLAGVGLGIVGALAMARFGEVLLYEVSSHDPVSYVIASTTLAIVGFLASFIPAWRATRVDAIAVLRCQ